ncbi:hypothetical protein RJ640_028078 [Escallonia rubra]|uniref:Large ribosomal subunit protein mL54 n=1 Tax=Escallonia rubra TaxID=112253 RepID=A0AA88QHA3_9ASTE|nr:hypothetical protein RJ640_028078 [Escallonia rubra]
MRLLRSSPSPLYYEATEKLMLKLELFIGKRGAKAKKGAKGGGAAGTLKGSTLSKEVKSTTVVGANILKDGTDPKILADSEYPDWLMHLLDKRPALSELRRNKIEALPYEDLKRFVKLDNRARIKENNSVKAKK